jgi:hypothetical protein
MVTNDEEDDSDEDGDDEEDEDFNGETSSDDDAAVEDEDDKDDDDDDEWEDQEDEEEEEDEEEVEKKAKNFSMNLKEEVRGSVLNRAFQLIIMFIYSRVLTVVVQLCWHCFMVIPCTLQTPGTLGVF